MIVTVAECECGEEFKATFQMHFVPRGIEYKLIGKGIFRHLAAGHSVTYTKTGRMTYNDD